MSEAPSVKDEAVAARNDHGADRIRTLDMAVVEHLDAARRRRQPEPLGEGFEQAAL